MDWRRSPWLVGVAALLLHAAGIVDYVSHFKGTPDVLMGVGRNRLQFPVYSEIKKALGEDGYDGQYYYAIAHAPFARYGLEVDFPAGRQLRILFPLLGYLASFGNPALLPYAMPAVNLLLIGLMTVLAAKWNIHHGLNPWYGLTLPVVINALLPSLRNLTDTAAMATAFWLVYAVLRDLRPWWVGLAGLAAVLAREQNAAILALVIGHSLWQSRWGTASACAVAAALWAGWIWWLTDRYGTTPFLPAAGNFSTPFDGLRVAWNATWGAWEAAPLRKKPVITHWWAFVIALLADAAIIWRLRSGWRGPAIAVSVVILLIALRPPVFGFVALGYHVGLMLAWVVFAVRFRKAEMLALGMATGGLLLHILGGPAIFTDYWAYGRAFFWLPMGLWILTVQARWEKVLLWSGLVAYLPVSVIKYG